MILGCLRLLGELALDSEFNRNPIVQNVHGRVPQLELLGNSAWCHQAVELSVRKQRRLR
jgi:hypothetical protein